MEAKHTPAPWVSHLTGYTGRASAKYVINDKKGRAVAHIKHSTISPMEANARLIAEAPDMLDILQKLADADFGSKGWTDYLEVIARQARLVIAKVTGEQA